MLHKVKIIFISKNDRVKLNQIQGKNQNTVFIFALNQTGRVKHTWVKC